VKTGFVSCNKYASTHIVSNTSFENVPTFLCCRGNLLVTKPEGFFFFGGGGVERMAPVSKLIQAVTLLTYSQGSWFESRFGAQIIVIEVFLRFSLLPLK
jgi:hypothetical protein